MAVNDPFLVRSGGPAYGLRVSAYDRTSSLLIALLVLVGASVLGLLVVFFSSRLETLPPAIPVTPVATPSDSRAQAEGETTDAVPGVENAPDNLEPDLESLLEQVSLAATSDAVLMAEKAAADSANLRQGASGGDTRGVGVAGGDGDSDAREPLREIRFEPESFDEYAAWFDAAGLEIAVLGADNRVYYATRLSSDTPVVRSGDPADERRLYFNSQGGPLYPLDKRLAEKAGLLERGSLIVQFCSAATQRKLLGLEEAAAGGRATADIARTVFKVVRRAGAYDFEVDQQQFYR